MLAVALLAGCGPDLVVSVQSGVDAEPALRRFLRHDTAEVESIRSTDDGLAIKFAEGSSETTLGAVRAGLTRVVRATPTQAPLVLELTDSETHTQDEPRKTNLVLDHHRSGIGLYSSQRFTVPTMTLCAWNVHATNLPTLGQGFEVRSDAPAELREALSGIADTLNEARLVQPHEFLLGDEPLVSGAKRVETQPDSVLFVFHEEMDTSMGASGLGLPPSKFRACMRTAMREASDEFVANVMFPTLSASVQGFSIP